MTTGAFVPPVDIYEDQHGIQLKLEVPGIDEKDLDIKVENNVLTVSGERKFEKEQKEENFHRIERRYGSFTRSFTLPNTVDTENIKADYNNGVLNIRLAKREEAKPKQIKVNIGQKPVEGKGVARPADRRPARRPVSSGKSTGTCHVRKVHFETCNGRRG